MLARQKKSQVYCLSILINKNGVDAEAAGGFRHADGPPGVPAQQQDVDGLVDQLRPGGVFHYVAPCSIIREILYTPGERPSSGFDQAPAESPQEGGAVR